MTYQQLIIEKMIRQPKNPDIRNPNKTFWVA